MRTSITLQPEINSPLSYRRRPIRIADDACGGLNRLASHYYGEAQLKFMDKFRGYDSYNLVDIGANVGLFSRQALINLPNIAHVFAYEPDVYNFSDAAYNLAPWKGGRLTLCNYGLLDDNGSFELYRDKGNCGNYSLNNYAMRDSFDKTTVLMRDINTEFDVWACAPIFWKSDVQGMDEILATFIEPLLWAQNVFAAIIELWRIPKPKLDMGRFREILELYPNRELGNNELTNLSVDDVCAYAMGLDYEWDDLYLWK